MMLHGCTQSPADFANGTGMNRIADAHDLIVVYPGQSRGANMQSCWNWFAPSDQERGSGEPAILAGLAVQIRQDHDIPEDRIFVAGLSAGGAMAVILGRAYPDVFTHVGVHSGLPYKAARDVQSAFAAMGGVPLILESLVPFGFEFSIIAARGQDGSKKAYDAVRNEHREGILRRSTVPAAMLTHMEEAAREATFTLMDALGYVGVIGVEYFALDDGTALANEFAPRVHNSGHWTEAACAISQFEQHIRAVAGLPLGDTRRHSDCVMENLIGEEIERIPDLLWESGVVLNLYGKTETRPGRKMGHFTRLSS